MEKSVLRTFIYDPAFDSPRMYARHQSQCGEDIVVITVWLGHESI
jgi:hypothetical protein